MYGVKSKEDIIVLERGQKGAKYARVIVQSYLEFVDEDGDGVKLVRIVLTLHLV